MENIKNNGVVRRRVVAVLFGLLGVFVIVIGWYYYANSGKQATEILLGLAKRYAIDAAQQVDGSDLQKLFLDTKGRNSTYYSKIQNVLKDVSARDPRIDDIYTLSPGKTGSDIWVFGVAVYETKDLNRDGIISEIERQVEIDDDYDISQYPELKSAYSENIALASEISHKDKWGIWYTAFAPIIERKQNRVVAVVGVDYSITEVEQNKDMIKTASIIFILLGFLIFILTDILSHHFYLGISELEDKQLSRKH